MSDNNYLQRASDAIGYVIETIKNKETGYKVRAIINGAFHNLKRDLDSRPTKQDIENLKTPYFGTLAELKSARPDPIPGDKAWVGTPFPGTVWKYTDSNGWEDTKKVPPAEEVNLAAYAKIEELAIKLPVAISLGNSSTINLNTDTKEIILKNAIIGVGDKRILPTPNIDIVVNYGNLTDSTGILLINYNTEDIIIINSSEYNFTLKNSNYALLGIIRSESDSYFINGNYSIDGLKVVPNTYKELNYKMSLAYSVANHSSVNVDLINNKIVFNGALIIIGNRRISIDNQEVDYSNVAGQSLAIFIDYKTRNITVEGVANFNTILMTKCMLGIIRRDLGFAHLHGVYSINGSYARDFTKANFDKLFNESKSVFLSELKPYAYSIGNRISLNVDTINKKIIFANAYIHCGNKQYIVSKEIDYSTVTDSAVNLLVRTDTGDIELVKNTHADNLLLNRSLLGIIRLDNPKHIHINGVYRIDGRDVLPYIEQEDKLFNFKGGYSTEIEAEILIHGNRSLNDLYSLYDDLVANHPHYVSKTLLGNDHENNPIYRYDFSALKPLGTSIITGDERNRILVTTHTHGYERQSAWGAYLFFKELCNPKHEVTSFLRANLRFTVIPIVTPTAFLNNSRKNSNGVDINRSFEKGFIVLDPSDEKYGGEYPLQELESQYINSLLTSAESKNLLFAVDKHNDGAYYSNDKRVAWVGSQDAEVQKFQVGWVKYHSQYMRDHYEFLVENPETGLSQMVSAPNASMASQFAYKGHKGLIYETTSFLTEITLQQKQKFEVESFTNFIYAITERYLER